MKKAFLILFAVFLMSCSGNQEQNTSLPTQVETTSAVVIDTQAPIQITPTMTVTPISTSTSSAFKFPSWVSNPNTTMVAALIKDDLKKTRDIQFFNAETGENYLMNISTEFGGFFWYDNMNFGLLSKDMKTSYKLNLNTGQVSAESVSPQSTRFLSEDWVNGLIIFDTSSSNEIVFDDSWQTNKSLNKKYTAEWIDDYTVISVTDTATAEAVWELPLPKNRYGTEFLWSPVDESHLAFLQGSPEPLNGDITEKMSLTIVDVASGEILSTYDGDFGILKWSPDGKMILFLDPLFRYRNYGHSFKDAPCLLILGTSEKRCLRSIPRIEQTGYILLTTGIYQWASDSNSIYYTYLYSLPSEWNILGNLCNYSLIDSHINCPTQNLEVLKERSVISYDISPDEQYIHFCYSASTILNDYADTANDGIIKKDGSNFFSWVGTIQDGGPQSCSIETLWRPLP